MQILWLPGWYPSKIEPIAGDFIQRHARAAGLYHHIDVLYIVRDRDGVVTKDEFTESFKTDNLHETIIYYYTPKTGFLLPEKVFSFFKYRKIYRKAVNAYLKKNGLPSFVHLHVVRRNGWMANWLKREFNLPFILSEHWTVYLPEAMPHFSQLSVLFRRMWHHVIKNAARITTVSSYLGNAITALQKDIHYTVIPNVVDKNIFFPVENGAGSTVHFMHVSTLGYQKNPEAIIDAFAIVKKSNGAFRLSVFGPPEKRLQKRTVDLGLQDHISFYHEVPQQRLAAVMQQADALILYSRYETFGCVLIEANACGIPAIVSNIPVFHEIIKEGVNGYFVEPENPAALAEKIIWFMEHPTGTGKQAIAATTEKYSFSNVGEMFSQLYATLPVNSSAFLPG